MKAPSHHRIDELARWFADRQSRRGVLRAALAFAATTIMMLNRPRDVRGQECPEGCSEEQSCIDGMCQRPCQTHRDCRSKKHDDPCISNTCVEGFCVEAIVDCLPGFECCRGECCPKSCTNDDECAILAPCHFGRCGEAGICEFMALDPCLTCVSDAECAASGPNTVCCFGSCRRPCPEGSLMSKGCECRADGSAALNGDGLVVRDDASG
jgi:hypothetical protein